MLWYRREEKIIAGKKSAENFIISLEDSLSRKSGSWNEECDLFRIFERFEFREFS